MSLVIEFNEALIARLEAWKQEVCGRWPSSGKVRMVTPRLVLDCEVLSMEVLVLRAPCEAVVLARLHVAKSWRRCGVASCVLRGLQSLFELVKVESVADLGMQALCEREGFGRLTGVEEDEDFWYPIQYARRVVRV